MATATLTEDTRLFSTARGTHAGAGGGGVSNHSPRLRKARYRLLPQPAVRLICNLLLWAWAREINWRYAPIRSSALRVSPESASESRPSLAPGNPRSLIPSRSEEHTSELQS